MKSRTSIYKVTGKKIISNGKVALELTNKSYFNGGVSLRLGFPDDPDVPGVGELGVEITPEMRAAKIKEGEELLKKLRSFRRKE